MEPRWDRLIRFLQRMDTSPIHPNDDVNFTEVVVTNAYPDKPFGAHPNHSLVIAIILFPYARSSNINRSSFSSRNLTLSEDLAARWLAV